MGGIPHGATQNNLRDEFSKVGEAQRAGVDGMCHAIADHGTKMHQDAPRYGAWSCQFKMSHLELCASRPNEGEFQPFSVRIRHVI